MDRSLLCDVFASRYGNLDLAAHDIELHLKADGLPSGVLGLMLGELLGDRYSYEMDEAVDVARESAKLLELDRTHPGPEHGPRRHFVNSHLESAIPPGCDLLDFGCGTARYKEYYRAAGRVTAVDVNPHALLHLRAFFPDPVKYKVVAAPFCLTSLESGSFDCVLLSAVIGYVPGSVADVILNECHRLLRPGGRLLVGLVPTAGLFRLGTNRSLLYELKSAPGCFHHKYQAWEIAGILAARGYRVLSSENYIVKLPHSLRKKTSALYGHPLVRRLDRLVNRNCWFSTWQIVVGEKKR